MLNRILSVIGLMTIARAKTLSGRLYVFNQKSMMDYAAKDFGAKAEENYQKGALEWWNSKFDILLSEQSDDICIIGFPDESAIVIGHK